MPQPQAPDDDFASAHWRHAPPAPDALPAHLPPTGPGETELRLLADNLPSLCWIAESRGDIVWYNRRWHDYCGTTPAEMHGWGWQSVHDPAILPSVMAGWSAAIQNGEAFEMTFPLRGADGVFRPFLTRVTPMRDASGQVLRWFGNNTDITPQQRIEEALAQSEAHVRLLLNASAEALNAVDADGICTACNATFLTMMGFDSEQQVIGKRLHGLIHHTRPDGSPYPDTECPIYACATAGTSAHIDHEYFYRLDGTPVAVEYWVKPLLVDGQRQGAVCTFLDITARRAAEAARHDMEQRLRALNADLERQVLDRTLERGITWQISPLLLSVIDLADGTFIRVNPAWTATLGWTEEQLTGRPFHDILHPDDAAATEPAWQAVQAGQPALNVENRYVTADGGTRWLSWISVPEDGKVYSTARDITAEKHQAALVAERTRERDRLWTVSEDLLAVGDYEGHLLRCSPSWTRRLGYTEAELLAGTYTEIIHPEDRQAVDATLLAMRQTRRPGQIETRIRAKDATWRRIVWTLSPDPDGRQVTGVGRDVTETREVEERLRQSQKMEAVGQLTGGLAHDFNNLLTGITGSLELLQTRVAQGRLADVERYITAAQGAARRAASLTHRLLAFSRRQTLDPRPTDLNRLMAGMEELIRRTLGPGIVLEFVSTAGLWTTLADPSQLENSLLNLCINARDAMPDGGRLTVETGNVWLDARAAGDRDIAPGQYVSLSVSDTGTGMAADVIARAFDPFFTTKPIGQGTGLGLSMVYGFVRQSGGQARIYSAPGQGTTVRLYLPRHMGPADAAEAPAGAIPTLQARQSETVLVVDDEPTVRMLVVEVLADLGYTAIEAADAAAGLRVLETGARIDLMITDVGLPHGMNGRQLADAARTLRPGLTVLFITGYAENARISHGHLDPGMHVLTKPFAMEVLAGRIRALIGAIAPAPG